MPSWARGPGMPVPDPLIAKPRNDSTPMNAPPRNENPDYA